MEAWQAASSRKGMGQVLSRDDLAGYFERAHSKPIPQTRSQRLQDVGDYTVKFGVAPAPVRACPASVMRAWSSALHACPLGVADCSASAGVSWMCRVSGSGAGTGMELCVHGWMHALP